MDPTWYQRGDYKSLSVPIWWSSFHFGISSLDTHDITIFSYFSHFFVQDATRIPPGRLSWTGSAALQGKVYSRVVSRKEVCSQTHAETYNLKSMFTDSIIFCSPVSYISKFGSPSGVQVRMNWHFLLWFEQPLTEISGIVIWDSFLWFLEDYVGKYQEIFDRKLILMILTYIQEISGTIWFVQHFNKLNDKS